MTARESPVPLFHAWIAVFKTLSTASMVLFASHFEPLALPLAFVFTMVGITLNMAVHRAAVTAVLESNVTPHLAMGFSGIFSTVDLDRVLAKW